VKFNSISRAKVHIRHYALPIYRKVAPVFEMFHQIKQVKVCNEAFTSAGLSTEITKIHGHIPEIAVFIPVAPKDYDKIPQCIASLRKHLLNPIHQFVICVKSDKRLPQICEELQCEFIDENVVAPLRKEDIRHQVDGIDRSGWIFQQLLKLSLFECVRGDNALIWDVDTCLIRKMAFCFDGKSVIEFEPNFHYPYFASAAKLLGKIPNFSVAFTCHKLLVNRKYMQEMFGLIEMKSNKKWYLEFVSAVDLNESSSISEYATYSLFMLSNHPETLVLQHWKNIAEYRKSSRLRMWVLSKWFKSISHHEYAQV